MKLQKFPILAAAIVGALSVCVTDLWAHGGGFGGGFAGGGRGGGGYVGRFGGARLPAGVVGGPPARLPAGTGGASYLGGVRALGFSRGTVGWQGPGVAGRPLGAVGERFNCSNRGCFDNYRFDHRRGLDNVAYSGGWYGYGPFGPYDPYSYGGYPTGYYDPYVANNANPAPAVDSCAVPAAGSGQQGPGLVAGDVVGNVQRVLKYRGFYKGPIDGLSGPTTRAAIRAYDASVGLPATGIIDARLLLSMKLM